ncbi:MAG: bifunctional oligoribonuclease/PAP phosphatase NrnA [Candidatus Edwardsbacteria bacterium]
MSFAEIIKVIKENQYFLITSHIDPDGDCIGAQLALCSLLKKLKKKVEVVNQDRIPERYRFLPGSENIQSRTSGQIDFTCAFVLDTAGLDRIGNVQRTIIPNGMVIINIDHHQSNDLFGNYSYVDSEASSTCELLYLLMTEMSERIGKERATLLYTGIMTDTGGLRFANTTARVFRICSSLVKEGASPAFIADQVYAQRNPKVMKLLGEVLTSLEVDETGNIGSLVLKRETYRRLGVNLSECEEFVNYAISVNGVKVGIFFREQEDGKIRVSLRSREAIDVNQIAAVFGGGGHYQAAGCKMEGELLAVKQKVLEEIKRQIK